MIARTTLLALALSAAACTSGPDHIVGCDDGLCDPDGESRYKLCAAIRGNGEKITAHFAAMARITEHYGLIDGAAGGSSASITQFIAESIAMNSAINQCGEAECTEQERRARAGLLFKSFPGYIDALSKSPEALAITELLPFIDQVKEAGIDVLLQEDALAARAALETLLGSSVIQDLLNPELLALLQTSEAPEFHVQDILDSISNLGSFSTDDVQIFVRPGIIHFEGLADKLGRIASFYAGYAPADSARMETFLSSCSSLDRPRSWFEVMSLQAGESTCGELFSSMVRDYHDELRSSTVSYPSRITEDVGVHLATLVSTSVLTGDAVEAFKGARTTYLKGEAVADIDIAWQDVQFGYWGNEADLAAVEATDPRNSEDAKTAKFLSLGQTTWQEALKYSPAEPGLARAQELDSRVSAGGWSDLQPVQVLKAMGCEKVIYVTRTDEESGFATGVARHFGLSDDDNRDLFDLSNEISSFSQSLAQADAIWCTDWNTPESKEIVRITLDAYNAPMISSDAFFTDGDGAYSNPPERARRGCTFGTTAAAFACGNGIREGAEVCDDGNLDSGDGCSTKCVNE